MMGAIIAGVVIGVMYCAIAAVLVNMIFSHRMIYGSKLLSKALETKFRIKR